MTLGFYIKRIRFIRHLHLRSRRGGSRRLVHGNSQVQLQYTTKTDFVNNYAWILRQCAAEADLEHGRYIHQCIIDNRLHTERFLGNQLIRMYGKCGALHSAQWVFDTIPCKNVFSWTVMIGAYADCTDPTGARRTFEGMPWHNVVSWNAMISAYVQCGQPNNALLLFQQMQIQGTLPNQATYATVLDACSTLQKFSQGKWIHNLILCDGFLSDIVVGTAIVNMYSKCGSLEDAKNFFQLMPMHNMVSWNTMIGTYVHHECIGDARDLFIKMPSRNLVSWNTMISAYAHDGQGQVAFQLFQQMHNMGIQPNEVTFISVLNACGNEKALSLGREMHHHILRGRFNSNIAVATGLISMYAKCGILKDAELAFNDACKQAVGSWNAIVAAYAQCGHLTYAHKIFDKMPYRDVISWNTIMAAYAGHGQEEEAFEMLRQMQGEGTMPDEITFVSLFYLSSHAGLLSKGFHFFASLANDYHLTWKQTHYNCMIDLLGRMGQLDPAQDFVYSMPFPPIDVTWITMLGSCRKYGDGKQESQLQNMS